MSAENAITIDRLSKRYQISAAKERYVALRDVLSRRLKRLGRQLLRRQGNHSPTQQDFWALRDVSFEVKRGDCVGIIGRNGAGKSTLLKILSRITEPTEGSVRLKGRVGSLLEVGTGFHPELTGRENIFLNGAILGMGRKEIARKFDEIVAFAEVDKFLDTPVKYYSSGMYTRLAFAVAAHLEPDVLVVDEVLAVGDAQFQKKCLGKMSEVANAGRTVLFVSHNMQAITQLTTMVVLLERGEVVFRGKSQDGVAMYTAGVFGEQALGKPYQAPPGNPGAHVAAVRVRTSDEFGEHVCNQPIEFEFDFHIPQERDGICFAVQICDDMSQSVCHFWLLDRGAELRRGAGLYTATLRVPNLRLYMGRYTLTTWLSDRRGGEILEKLSEICPFEVSMRGIAREEYDWAPKAMVYWEEGSWGALTRRELSAPVPSALERPV